MATFSGAYCQRCNNKIGDSPSQVLEFSVKVPDRPNLITFKQFEAHANPQDCDGLTWIPCSEHRGEYFADEGGHGCPVCTEMWSI